MSSISSHYGEGLYGLDLYGGTGLIPGTTIPGNGGGLTVWFELWRATVGNSMVEDISEYLTGGNVSLNHDRAITTQATFQLKDASVVSPYVDYLAVFQNTEYDDSGVVERAQLGLFTTPVPSGTRTIERGEGVYTGYDLTSVLSRYAFTDTYNIAGGTNYRTAVVNILALAGINRVSIEATTRTLATPLTFTIGTTYLEAANTLLEAIGFYNLSATPDGRLTSSMGRDVQYVQPFRIVHDADLMQEVQTQPTDTTVANIVIVIQDNTIEVPITAIRRNDSLDSPTSTVNLGEKVRVETRSNLADQAAVDSLADRLLAEGRTFYQVASLRTLPDPRVLYPHQVIELDLTGKLEIFSGKWRVRTSSIGFDPGSAGPVMEVNRISDSIRGQII